MKKISLTLILFLLGSGLLVSAPLQDKKVDLNKANEVELQQLPGIGPALAKRIVEHRSKNGPFAKLIDLLNVSGIGQKKFEALEPYITLTPDKREPSASQSKATNGSRPPSGDG